MKDFMNNLNSDNILYNDSPLNSNLRSNYLFNRAITEIDNMDCLLLVGVNPKVESPVLNARILKNVRHNNLKVFNVGPSEDLGYKYVHLGNSYNTL